ncbi:RidA family protein [Pseudogemmatithrix spongiicola]|uniref:RidA family protein n=1 Tax=Pseudogemmatithrix spongiicola TaxID=3062599 RepID=A0AA49Q8Q3_9BACT|nr:RidA family protein [Gemmatimonadaceae bacterium 'strain 138']WKW16377.1 RidA family protein [Gemmatimonadaceae bacterium 'strain 318']
MRDLRIAALASGVAVAAAGLAVALFLREGAARDGTLPQGADVEYLTPFGKPTRPFSPAVRVGDLLFLSGQIGTDASANGGLIAGGIEAETRQTLENIKRTVEAVGSSMDKVVKCTVMMADMAEWDRMNVVYREFFPEGRLPARSAFGASGLALGARVEIECIATR